MKRIDKRCYCKRRYDSAESVCAEIIRLKKPLFYYKCKVGGTTHYHMSHKKLKNGKNPTGLGGKL